MGVPVCGGRLPEAALEQTAHSAHLGADEPHFRELPQQLGGRRPLQQELRRALAGLR